MINDRVNNTTKREFWSEVLPDPDSLKKYDAATIRAIFADAKERQISRHRLEKNRQRDLFFRERCIQFLGGILSIAAMLGGIFLIADDYFREGIILIVLSLLMCVGGWISIWLRGQKDKNKKSPESDLEAMRGDWMRVGDDLRAAMLRHSKNR